MNGLSYFLARKTASPWPELVDGPHDDEKGIDRSIELHRVKGDDGPWIVLVGFDPADDRNELVHPLPEPLR